MQKYIDEKCLYCSSFFCFLTLHAGTGGIHKFLGFLIMLVFQSRISNQLFTVNARNSLKSLVVSSDSEPEVEPFITQITKAASVAVLQELQENNLNIHLQKRIQVQKKSKQLTISIFAPNFSTDLHVYMQRRFGFVEPQNFRDAVNFRTVVVAVEIDERTSDHSPFLGTESSFYRRSKINKYTRRLLKTRRGRLDFTL